MADPAGAPIASGLEGFGEGVEIPQPSVKAMLWGAGPRFARDAFLPVLAFYVGWKTVGLPLGIGLATIASVLAWRHERRQERSGLLAGGALVFVLVQAAIGLASGSAAVYLAQPVLLNGVLGLAFVISVIVRRPLAALFADEFYPFPAEVKASVTFRKVFGRISLGWGVYLLARSALRLLTLSTVSVDAFVVVNLVTGAPFTAGIMGWSVWYGVRGFRRSEEWGWAITPAPAPAPAPATSA